MHQHLYRVVLRVFLWCILGITFLCEGQLLQVKIIQISAFL